MQKVGQKLSRSRNTFSETSVATLANSKIVQPAGKQLWNENDEESSYKALYQVKFCKFHQTISIV